MQTIDTIFICHVAKLSVDEPISFGNWSDVIMAKSINIVCFDMLGNP